MSNWKTVRLGDVCDTISATYKKGSKSVVLINTSDVLAGKVLNHKKESNENLKGQFKKTFQRDDILYSEIRPQNRRFAFIDFEPTDYIASTKLMVLRCKECILPKYLFQILSSDEIIQNLQALAETRSGTFPQITFSELSTLEISLPSLEEQGRIAGILGALDDEIECNNRINRNLEEQAAVLFRRWFVDFEFPDPDPTSPTYGKPYRSAGGKMQDSPLGSIPKGWQVGTLTSIANYINGLAMQKFRPSNNEQGMPVLKIKELGQKKCDSSSDLCSEAIKPEYIVSDGDIIFSWSGTLMVDIWCGGKCGLNQHLFKVTSEKYPKWFYYFWTDYHLHKFIKIAKDKAVTMGHIKREDLNNSAVIIPDNFTLKIIDGIMTPLLDKIIFNNLESRNLATLRDTLLPKLMNNQIKI